jgi:radical SAM family uncharacterized protein
MNKKLDKILCDVEKPARYAGGEYNAVVKDVNNVNLRFALCFPDIYEIGMSHLGIKILYDIMNGVPDIWAERVFDVWEDMRKSMSEFQFNSEGESLNGAKMAESGIPLYTLESKTPLAEMDVIGFTLQYELSYASILDMLELAQIPLLAVDRGENFPIICAGGPCAYNPEPLADFFDFFLIGEAEEAILEICGILKKNKKSSKSQKLKELALIEGVYVPALTEIKYSENGAVESISRSVKKRVVSDLDKAGFPVKPVVPFIEAVHDRITLEVMRGCMRGCRFCQAGYIYRPLREKAVDRLCETALLSYKNTGYDEISLTSLSTSDYSKLKELKTKLNEFTKGNMVNLSLPSLRIDNFKEEAAESLSEIRKSTLTFAPEAGSQRMRDIINKNISEETILETMEYAFSSGFSNVKLYFMLGLPFEEDEDVAAIAELVWKLEGLYNKTPKENRGRGLNITVSVSSFVPKAHTPFQWFAQNSYEELIRKQNILKGKLRSRRVRLNWHDAETSVLEAAFARGGRDLGKVLMAAHKLGCKLDGWNECFSYEKWLQAFERAGIDPRAYSERKWDFDAILPWDTTDCGVTKKFLRKEAEKAQIAATTPNCREKCAGCGVEGCGQTGILNNVQWVE